MSFLTIQFPDGAVMKYDPVARVAYIKVRAGLVAETREEAPNVMVDLDAKGHLLGVEIISPKSLKYESKVIAVLRKISKEFDVPQLRDIDPRVVGAYQPA
jgi:uncharacterized protein YuzE